MNKPENMEARLWDYIDGLCNEQEHSFIAALIEENQAWREKYHQLLDEHQLLQQSIELDEPSMRFSQNVMDVIANEKIAPAASSYIKKSVIRGIAAFFLISLAALVVYMFASVDWSAANKSSSFKMPELSVSKFMNNTVLYSAGIITAVLALAILDSTLRKRQQKNREMMEQ